MISPEDADRGEGTTIFISSEIYEDSMMDSISRIGFAGKVVRRTSLERERSWSEFGEDIFSYRALERYGVEDIYYMEIGIPWAAWGSNTRYLYNKGYHDIASGDKMSYTRQPYE